MILSPYTIRRFGRSIAYASAVAAIAVPMAQAGSASNGKYGPLDPWAYSLIHHGSESVRLITEHSAGQNGTGQPSAAGKYGPLDPAIAAAIRNQSRGQKSVSRSAATSVPAAAKNGFDWRDAGIGALGAFAIALLAFGLAVATLRQRRNRVPAL